ncbi:MAG: CocE/NonD family hydrolase [Sphingomonas sp.]|uniref:CocE/NonD family hydrolase n=1 Tax=Sphingomonas sp. TaxID=28214 RepID=UPI001AD1D01B|nr:CocE/NonD family hydrolase [Sphingomonas sp.]MBN8816837.1 CocE/NonD family hydrolase [Sphingomonas sp.]
MRFQPSMRAGTDPYTHPTKPPLPPADYHRRVERGLIIERNCRIPLRDGVELLCDVYRPENAMSGVPLLLAWGPYGKHALTDRVFWPRSGVDPDWLSDLTAFEAPDPVWWGEQGFAVAVVDPRGAWLSGGDFHHNGSQEAEDCADAIEWLGRLPWANGRVGISGVSYLAGIQYLVAPLRPGPLAALNPWEAFSDWYREFAYHGGILETSFLPRACDNIQWSLHRTEDSWANINAHQLIDDYWRSKEFDLEAIRQPAYVVASWSDQGLHLRGTIEAYRRMGSAEKWLEIHGQKKWAHYYRSESRKRQLAFFDHYLRDRPTSLPAWPKVRIEVRERHGVAEERAEREWPIARTDYRRLALDAANGALTAREPAEAEARYPAETGSVAFDLSFDTDTEITGHASLRLWVEADGSDDVDLFVALQKINTAGGHVGFTFYAFYENGPVALGWQRVSHRALDPARSRPEQPVHLHTYEERLEPGACVLVEIEIWPFSARFSAGETLRLIVAGHDIYRKEEGVFLPFPMHEQTRNAGTHIIRTGGVFDSSILLPFVPPREDQT